MGIIVLNSITNPLLTGLDWDKKIGPGMFLVQAAHHHFELYIYIQEEHVPAR